MDERTRKDRLTVCIQIAYAYYNSQLDQLERKYKLHSNDDISWQDSIVFVVICKLIKELEENRYGNLLWFPCVIFDRPMPTPVSRISF